MNQLPGKFVWYEHLSNDTEQASKFYEALFGWDTVGVPVGTDTYSVIHNGGKGIGGYRTTASGSPSQWMPYLSVASVDASYAAALAAGAHSLAAPMDFGSAGRGATLADPTGGVLSLWTGAQDDPPDTDQSPHGSWYWNELSTQDEKAALAFYQTAFGFTHDAMPMPLGTYYLLKKDDKLRAGLLKAMDASIPTMWLQYVAVDDCDAAAERAASLGATIVAAPSDIPQVGRFAMFVDPQGAALAVMKPNPTMT